MTALFIVLLHAVPVFVIGVWTKNKVALTFAAIVAGIIGVATGNPAYAVADLIGIAIALWLGISFINDQKPTTPPQTEKPSREPENKKDSSWGGGVIGIAIVAASFYHKATDKSAPLPTPTAQAPHQSTTYVPQQVQVPIVQPPKQADIALAPQRPKRVERQNNSSATNAASNATMQDLRDNCKPPTCRIVN